MAEPGRRLPRTETTTFPPEAFRSLETSEPIPPVAPNTTYTERRAAARERDKLERGQKFARERQVSPPVSAAATLYEVHAHRARHWLSSSRTSGTVSAVWPVTEECCEKRTGDERRSESQTPNDQNKTAATSQDPSDARREPESALLVRNVCILSL